MSPAADLPPWARRAGLCAAVGGGLLLFVAAAAPGARSRPGRVAVSEPIPEPDAVRIPRGDGLVVVYDKRRSYVAAELAERWPSVVCDILPGDRIEVGDAVHEVRPELRWPWWR